jgi:methylamine dehydrogenase heavy chain
MTKIAGLVVILLSVCAWIPSSATEKPFRPQQLTAKPAIDPGPNIFTSVSPSSGAGAIHVFSATDLSYKGSMSSGAMGQVLLSRDGKTAYAASLFMTRVVYGEKAMVLQIYDVATLSLIKEIPLPPKLAQVLPQDSMLVQSADGRYVYVQNATPATSVTVVDVVAGKVTGEIPSPGCFGIYPSLEGDRFSAICGDGTFASYTLRPDGTSADRTRSQKIFDADKDPIFMPAARVGLDLVFISYHGNIYRVTDSGPVDKLTDTYSVTAGVTGGWAPGGTQLIAYNKANDILFIAMHPNARDGSHKQPAKEVWAYSLTSKKILYRSPVDGINALTVSDAPVPVLYASKALALMRFEVDPDAKFALKKSYQVHNPGGIYNDEIVLRP